MQQARRAVISAVFILLLAGCATQRIDWNTRVGHYTYDDAVLELGPPDRASTLSDGTLVAEWFAGRAPRSTVGIGFGFGRGPVGTGIGMGYPVGPGGVRVLRLTFDPDRILRATAELSH